MVDIVLASASPRRRELLMGILPFFRVVPVEIDEECWFNGDPEEGARLAALEKARVASVSFPGSLVIGSDTVVVSDHHILGKPKDAEDACRMLGILSGREHEVMTGVALVGPGGETTGVEITRVRFSRLSSEQIQAYVATEEPFDKAGAYGIQGRASAFVEGINGCYFNVVGLPVFRLAKMLEERGICVWRFWDSSSEKA